MLLVLYIAVALIFSSCTFGEISSDIYDEIVLSYDELASDGAIVVGHATNRTNCTPDALEEALPSFTSRATAFVA